MRTSSVQDKLYFINNIVILCLLLTILPAEISIVVPYVDLAFEID